MCLNVFVKGDRKLYEDLKDNAMKLGAAFQKINFLRDLNEDVSGLGRVYFPDMDMAQFSEEVKDEIEKEIQDESC